jgi:hypothetical protein
MADVNALALRLALSAACLAGCSAPPRDQIPSPMAPPPWAEGFGAGTVGGGGSWASTDAGGDDSEGRASSGGAGTSRIGRVIHVTTLSDGGPGSLRDACAAAMARVIEFRVSGEIELESPLLITAPFVTIDGSTAPGDGVTITGHGLIIRADEVIIRHLRIRPGTRFQRPQDALWIDGCRNVLVDHCSLAWAGDETLSVTGGASGVTVQWCIMAEALSRPWGSEHRHGFGSIISAPAASAGVTFHHNLYAHHDRRLPRIEGTRQPSPARQGPHPSTIGDVRGVIDFRNNVIYDWGALCGSSDVGDRFALNLVGNVYVPGPSTAADTRGTIFRIGGPHARVYIAGNRLEGPSGSDRWNWSLLDFTDEAGVLQRLWIVRLMPFPTATVRTHAAPDLVELITRCAGATLPRRDEVDARIIAQWRGGTGGIVDAPP